MSFFEKMQAREKVKPGTLSKIFASHRPSRVGLRRPKSNSKPNSQLALNTL